MSTFRTLGLALPRVRDAHDYLAQVLESEHPFATGGFKSEGQQLVLALHQAEPDAGLDRLVVVDRSGDATWQDAIRERFRDFDYDGGLVARWRVTGPDSSILIDPRISFGAPIINGIATWAIKGRWSAGETLEEIADNFGLDETEVREALDFEGVGLAA